MAFGFPARYRATERVREPLGVLVAATKLALEDLALDWYEVDDTTFRASHSMGMLSWGERMTVEVDEGKVACESRCSGPQVIDWGKNRKNVEAFLTAFRDTLEEERSMLPPAP